MNNTDMNNTNADSEKQRYFFGCTLTHEEGERVLGFKAELVELYGEEEAEELSEGTAEGFRCVLGDGYVYDCKGALLIGDFVENEHDKEGIENIQQHLTSSLDSSQFSEKCLGLYRLICGEYDEVESYELIVRRRKAALVPAPAEELKQSAAPVLGQAWTLADLKLTLMPIHPGTFMMGSKNGHPDERPLTKVKLTKPYWLGKTQVTQAQWEAIMGTKPSQFNGPTLPVEHVSWDDAMAFCAALTQRESAAGRLPAGYVYTLPTEAQWEYACRAGTTGDYAGDLDAMAWYEENRTHRVGTKQANAWGLHDMHGNVEEWCWDWYGDYPGGKVVDFIGNADGFYHDRVLRGGRWCVSAACCRSACRAKGPPHYGYYNGFRLALAPIVEPVKSTDTAKESAISAAPAMEPVQGAAPVLGQAWTLADLKLTLMPIQPGTFMMGSQNGRDNEKPQTLVTLSMPYWLGRTEVTQAQWEAIMGTNPSHFKGPTQPVEQVSWSEAMAFCRALSKREGAAGRLPAGYKYTLPTEAQWEYACRAGTTGEHAGDLDAMAWYFRNRTHRVGTKQANAWGLHDMHGNVEEWCRNWEGDYPGGSVVDPTGPASGSCRISRGGYYGSGDADCSSAHRAAGYPAGRDYTQGFRLALAPAVKPANSAYAEELAILAAPAMDPVQGAAPVLGQAWTLADVQLTLKPIQPGSFMMGSQNKRANEKPQTQVTLTMPYWLGKTQVTRAQWEVIMGPRLSERKGPTLPVRSVLWGEAMTFCAVLTRREEAAGRLPAGYEYTLPTEAQWEYACRAGTSGDYAGDLDEMAWYAENDPNSEGAHPVATKQANPWGLHDMHGNLWEWCRDRLAKYPGGSVTDPSGPASGSCRVLRGGSCYNDAAKCRSAFRDGCQPGISHCAHGFRLALAPKVKQ